MILWQNPITDRKQSDVEYALSLISKKWSELTESQKDEYIDGLKGSLNKSDIERIYNNMELLNEVLELGIDLQPIPTIPDDIFFYALLDCVKDIREAYMVHADTPAVPVAPLNTYTKWNDIEKILLDVYEILGNNFFYYCGNEIYAGDSTGLLL